MRGTDGNETSSVSICRRGGVDHPSGHDVGFGCAKLANLSDLPASTFAFVLRAPTCASVCSYSVCWVWCSGAVAGVVEIEVGVVSGVFNLESSGVDAPDWRPRHDEH